MNPDRQQSAILEAVGFSKCDPVKMESDKVWHWKGHGFRLENDLPDFLNDLDAMHEAEKALCSLFPKAEHARYIENLQKVIGGVPGCFAHYSAEASQRAEAFLRTIGKWEDGE